jgi:arylsulfatase A-like enzyme
MRVVFLLFDTLVRNALAPYVLPGSAGPVPTPNFARLAERAVTFDNHYVGSLPCMPARRDMHTGRLNFMHRSWGPLEPFDDSFPELIAAHGVHSHLVSDHYHYWEDGGATYHNRYSTYEFVRGQEADPWKAMVEPPLARLRQMYHALQYSAAARHKFRVHMVNREFIRDDTDFPSWQCFHAGLDFIERNRGADNWLLQIETFDPHEPFFAPKRFRAGLPTNYRGPILDWPPYDRVRQTADECDELRANYFALLAFCDELLGQVLDAFDHHGLWRDTALVVTTDHGFLLGEHDWWAKLRMPVYQEVAHIPLFVHTPAAAHHAGRRRQSLTQTMDLMPTFLELFGAEVPRDVQAKSLLPVLEADAPQRDAALYGHWGAAVNVTDGRHTYFRYPLHEGHGDLFQYTLMPTHMTTRFSVGELAGATLARPFPFTKNVPLLRVPASDKSALRWTAPGFYSDCDTVLYDLQRDPQQLQPVRDTALEACFAQRMTALMREAAAPAELYRRLGLDHEQPTTTT